MEMWRAVAQRCSTGLTSLPNILTQGLIMLNESSTKEFTKNRTLGGLPTRHKPVAQC